MHQQIDSQSLKIYSSRSFPKLFDETQEVLHIFCQERIPAHIHDIDPTIPAEQQMTEAQHQRVIKARIFFT